jgi:hypothetical protein
MVLVDPFGSGVRYALIASLRRRVEEAFNRCSQAKLVVFDQQRKSDCCSMILAAIAFWQSIASMVTR